MKRNKILAALVILILLMLLLFVNISYFLLRNNYTDRILKSSHPVSIVDMDELGELSRPSLPNFSTDRSILPRPNREFTPRQNLVERVLVEESTLSLLVDDVSETTKKIVEHVENLGGYMVDSSLYNPSEEASGQLTVRIPQQSLEEALDYFRSIAIKVVSENLKGRDVSDEFVDVQARLETLRKTKQKFEEIMTKASKVEDILRVQKELIQIQEQIDQLNGREQYLKQIARLSKVTIYISTDELALPYEPLRPWRPKVIFKQAVRSLFRLGQNVISVLIWITVYSAIGIPLILLYRAWQKRRKKINVKHEDHHSR